MRVGVYPGTFNPPTIAHLAIAAAARDQRRLDQVVLVMSRRPINKEHVERPTLRHRLEVLQAVAEANHEWLRVELTDHRLLVDIARGYDVLIMGADKWLQVIDPQYYDNSTSARDAALTALPELAIAPRENVTLVHDRVLEVSPAHQPVSSTGARQGVRAWMCAEAADFDDRTGAWTDPARYDAWLRTQ